MHRGALTAGSSRGYCCYGSCYKCSVCGCFFVQSHHNKNICPVISESKEQKSSLSRSTNQVMFSYLQASTLKAMQPTLWKPNRSFCMREQCLPLSRQVKMPFHFGDCYEESATEVSSSFTTRIIRFWVFSQQWWFDWILRLQFSSALFI